MVANPRVGWYPNFTGTRADLAAAVTAGTRGLAAGHIVWLTDAPVTIARITSLSPLTYEVVSGVGGFTPPAGHQPKDLFVWDGAAFIRVSGYLFETTSGTLQAPLVAPRVVSLGLLNNPSGQPFSWTIPATSGRIFANYNATLTLTAPATAAPAGAEIEMFLSNTHAARIVNIVRGTGLGLSGIEPRLAAPAGGSCVIQIRNFDGTAAGWRLIGRNIDDAPFQADIPGTFVGGTTPTLPLVEGLYAYLESRVARRTFVPGDFSALGSLDCSNAGSGFQVLLRRWRTGGAWQTIMEATIAAGQTVGTVAMSSGFADGAVFETTDTFRIALTTSVVNAANIRSSFSAVW